MIDYFIANPRYILLIFALLIVTIFLCFEAARSSIKRGRENQKILDRLNKEKELIEKYKAFERGENPQVCDENLVRGKALLIQSRVSNASDINAFFDSLCREDKILYALECFLEDYNGSLSSFFKLNTQPLTPLCKEFFEKYYENKKVSEIYNRLYCIFDENNEEISFEKSEVEGLDEEFAEVFKLQELFLSARKYLI